MAAPCTAHAPQVHVKNDMKDNGYAKHYFVSLYYTERNRRNLSTSIHWHGVRQFENSKNDGVNGVTECPLAPEDEKVYTFTAEQYGKSGCAQY